jgi:hypothetical protein
VDDFCHLLFLDPCPEGFELGIKARNHLVDGLPVAFRTRFPGGLGQFDQCRTTLDLAGSRGAEEHVAALHIEDGGIHQGAHVVLAAVDHIGADDGPVQQGQAVAVAELDLIVGNQGHHVHVEHPGGLLQVLEASPWTQVGRGDDLDGGDVGAVGKGVLDPAQQAVTFHFRQVRMTITRGKGDAHPQGKPQLRQGSA